MTRTGRVVLWSAAGVGAVVIGGVIWARLSPSTFPIKGLVPAGGIASNGLCSLSVQGYATGASATAPTGNPITVSAGNVVVGFATVHLGTTASGSTALGVRAWTVQWGAPASLNPSSAVSVGTYSGLIEGHLYPTSGSTSPDYAALTLSPGGSGTVRLYSGEIEPDDIAWADPTAATKYLGVLWAVGPAAEVEALQAGGGTYPTGGDVAYNAAPSTHAFIITGG